MDLIMLIVVLAIVGFVVWIVTTKIPMDPTYRIVLQVIAAVLVLIYVLRRLGFIPNVM